MECHVMRMAKRAILRLALVGWLGVSGLAGLSANLAQAATPPERVLPDSTVFLVKINDVKALREAFRQSQYGQLWNDPALKDFRDDLAAKLKDASKTLKEKIGVTLQELFELPQGAWRSRPSLARTPSCPSALAIIADAGKNQEKMVEVLNRSTKQAEEAQAKVSHRSLQGADPPHHPAARIQGEEGRRRQAGSSPSALGLDQFRQPLLHRQQRRASSRTWSPMPTAAARARWRR